MAGKNDGTGKKDKAAKLEVNVPKEAAEQAAEVLENVTLTPEEFNQVKAHIESLQTELNDTISMAQRLQADFDNYRKRNAALSAESLEEGTRVIIKALLPVIDNFERAMDSMGTRDCPDSSWYDGIKLVYRQLMDVLAKSGFEEIPTVGMFDPELHDAVLQEEEEGAESGSILSVLLKGYKVKDRIIRHSMVKVAK